VKNLDCSTLLDDENLLLPSFGISSPTGFVNPPAKLLNTRGGILDSGVGVAVGATSAAGAMPDPEPPPQEKRKQADANNIKRVAAKT
jgi:hypothetical protein